MTYATIAAEWPIGSTATLPVDVGGGVLSVPVIVLDARSVFGRLDIRVRPVGTESAGGGWVSADRLIHPKHTRHNTNTKPN